ncbi:hypothetical protein [Gloeothece verrucosa]|uniref:Uncharacterized protein n=1 Tax=Gloeothece verrucosa (strain PCC 7822) TaxID=497965 RepID=E0UFS6_GLOV7|nr:hypothetical protein [Gloeothece verrucosa]ADN13187.1 conserved hypothetical protein [Gloeothece verrucosa PCC 7822]
MKTVSGLKNKSVFIIGLLTIGVLGSPMAVSANETATMTNPSPLVSPTGTVGDLNGVSERDLAQNLGGIGGTSEDLQVPPQSDLRPEMSAYEAKTRALNLTLDRSDEKLGDTSRITRRLPLVHF